MPTINYIMLPITEAVKNLKLDLKSLNFVVNEDLKCDGCNKIKYELSEKVYIFPSLSKGICQNCFNKLNKK